MGKGRTTIKQPIEIKLDLEDFINLLQDKLCEAVALSEKNIHSVSINDWYLDDTYVCFKGAYQTGADTWYYRATLEEPEDSGYEPDAYLSQSEIQKELNQQIARLVDVSPIKDCTFTISNSMTKYIRLAIVDDDEEPIMEFDDDVGSDPDRAYDEWKDRRLEG